MISQAKAGRSRARTADSRVARALLRDVTTPEMFSRVAACWLVVLVLAPFTAPFPTCDFGTLFGDSQTEHSPARMPASVIANDSIVASVPAISGVGRVRLSVLAGVFSCPQHRVPAATLTNAAAPADRLPDHAGLAAILRV
jgi:hypothetical protein